MIRAYVGRLGSGKTLCMVHDSLPWLLKGKRVVTNTPFFVKDSKARKDNPNYLVRPDGSVGYGPEFIESAEDYIKRFYTAEDCLFLIDEAAVVMPSGDWNKLPMKVVIKFAQSRKYAVDIFYTTQRYGHAIRRMRDLTNEVTKTTIFGFPPFQWIKAKTYEPEFFEGNHQWSPEWEHDMFIDSNLLWPWDLNHIFKIYDTFYKIKFNLVTETDLSKDVDL